MLVKRLLGVMAMALITAAGPLAEAQSPAQLRPQWEVDPGTSGVWRSVCGYIFNDGRSTARNVQIQVEGLDSSAKIVSSRRGYVPGDVLAAGRTYFCLPVAAGAANYRVSVLAASWDGGAP